jgi:hypothetical protein
LRKIQTSPNPTLFFSFFLLGWPASCARICALQVRLDATLCQDKGYVLLTAAADGLTGSSKHILGTLQAAYKYTPPPFCPSSGRFLQSQASRTVTKYPAATFTTQTRLPLPRCPRNAPLPLGYCRSWRSTRRRHHAASRRCMLRNRLAFGGQVEGGFSRLI